MKNFLSPEANRLAPYTPGEQPRDQQYVKLNTNENPYPPSERALAAAKAALGENLRLYPDPEAAARLHPNDAKRIIRALEVWRTTGKTITRHNEETRALPPRYSALTLTLDFERREDMWERIDRRVDRMMADGLAEEVRALLDSGVPERCTAMQAIGYKEMVCALRGDGDVRAAAEEIKLRSRQYAKRQLTWLRRNPAIHWIFWEKDRDFARALQISTEILSAEGVS